MSRVARKATAAQIKRAAAALRYKYPLAEALDQSSSSEPTKNYGRVSVVSEQLCDDALNQLAPSLHEYKGCHIVDFLPGVGLWSRKVHDLLRPCSHRLVEPKEAFHQFLQPLIDQPGSNYSLVLPPIGAALPLQWEETYQDVFNTTNARESSLLHEGGVNKAILVLATMTRDTSRKLRTDPDQRISIMGSSAEPFVYQFLKHMPIGIGLHTHGPVRLLLWTWDRDKFNYLPRTVVGRRATALRLEDCFHVNEIVGSAEPTAIKRQAKLEIRSIINTVRKMERSGVAYPEHRRSRLHEAVWKASGTTADKGVDPVSNIGNELQKEVEELDSLETAYADGVFKKNRAPEDGHDKRLKFATKEFLKMEELRDRLGSLVGAVDSRDVRNDHANNMAARLSELCECERRIASGSTGSRVTNGVPPFSLDEERIRRDSIEENVKRITKSMTRSQRSTLQGNFDNSEAVKQQPPLLPWDLRSLEPLECESEEFYPPHKLSLLDFQPKAIPTVLGMPGSVHSLTISRLLGRHYSKTIEIALNNISHGSAAAILPQCPTIHDPLQGGRLNLDNMRVRMLTGKMWLELIQAWESWPFKPNEESLLGQLSRSSEFIDFDNFS